MNRLLLFDIDGTILTTNGGAKSAFHRALLEVHGTAGPIDTHPFDGKTDPQIARELLREAGLDDTTIDRTAPRLWETYLRELEIELARPEHQTTVYPGVHALLDALEEHTETAETALLTGNIEQGAAIKLRSAGFDERFEFGAFGSDHERRDRLPTIAVERARERTGQHFQEREIIIIGDTPADITCGASLGVRAIGVATGRFEADDLHRAGADAVLENLKETEDVLELLLND